jgi:hypothetical protein
VRSLCCFDCGGEPWGHGEDFYVRNSLWLLVIPSRKRTGIICLDCFEKRLGRRLIRKDFQIWFRENRWFGDNRRKINHPISLKLSQRIKKRA